MRSTALLLLIGFLFLYSLKSNIVALYTYWWFAIFRPHEWAWNDILTNLHLPKIAALLFLGSALYHRKFPKINNSITILMILTLALESLATVLNGCGEGPAKHTFTLLDFTILIIVVLLTTESIEKRNTIAWLITVIGLSIGFHSGKSGIHALITGGDYYGAANLTGLFSGSNSYALGTGILVFFMIFSIQFVAGDNVVNRKIPSILVVPYRLIMTIIIFGSIYNIISLQSRGSFLATSFALLIWILLHEKTMKLLLVSLVSLSLALTIVPLPENYTDRIAKVFTDDAEERDKSAAGRPYLWNLAFEMSKDHPLGIGTGCYKGYFNQYDTSGGYFGYNRSVHSSHFQILADIGYLGLFVWFSLFFISYKKLWSIRKASRGKISNCEQSRFYFHISNALICAITTYLLGASFYEHAYNDLIWLMFGMVVALERLHSDDNKGNNVKKNIPALDR